MRAVLIFSAAAAFDLPLGSRARLLKAQTRRGPTDWTDLLEVSLAPFYFTNSRIAARSGSPCADIRYLKLIRWPKIQVLRKVLASKSCLRGKNYGNELEDVSSRSLIVFVKWGAARRVHNASRWVSLLNVRQACV